MYTNDSNRLPFPHNSIISCNCFANTTTLNKTTAISDWEYVGLLFVMGNHILTIVVCFIKMRVIYERKTLNYEMLGGTNKQCLKSRAKTVKLLLQQ